jgi:anti-anti-sigma factor
MEITKSQNGDRIVLAISGKLDTSTAPKFQESLLAAFNEAKQVELNFASVAYISSAGLRVLLLGQKAAIAKGCSMSLVNVPAEIKEVFEMTGFSDILKIG